jgi:hypothetical protein
VLLHVIIRIHRNTKNVDLLIQISLLVLMIRHAHVIVAGMGLIVMVLHNYPTQYAIRISRVQVPPFVTRECK